MNAIGIALPHEPAISETCYYLFQRRVAFVSGDGPGQLEKGLRLDIDRMDSLSFGFSAAPKCNAGRA
ncbi:hypothetical protein, partial [Mesorhizobium sp. M1348]|uniref:hypothetical protein n=1 Tax=Mesorhizobium sp. M1348 TaxID=2957089 RepID=UPI00333D86C0